MPTKPLDLAVGDAILATADAAPPARQTVTGVELLTWNCKHIANAKILPRIYDVLTDLGIPIPIICTPEEMVSDESEEE